MIQANHSVYKFKLILMEFPNLQAEGKNLSLPAPLSCSLKTLQDENRLRLLEVPDSIKFFVTHNEQIQAKQCHYAVTKE